MTFSAGLSPVDWVSSGLFKEDFVPVSKNSTPKVNFLPEVVTAKEGISDTFSVTNKTAVQFIPANVQNWERAEQAIKSSLDWQAIQIGEPTEAEFVIEDMIVQTSADETMRMVYDLYLNNADNTLLACTLIHALSHLEYEVVYPQGPMMAIAMFSSTDKRVVGFAVKAFSNWNSKDSLKYIGSFQPTEKWAKQELERVVNYIRENGDDLDVIFDEKNHATKVDTRAA